MRKIVQPALAALVAVLQWLAPAAQAEEPADFFRGKTLTIYVAVGPGAYDLYARVLAQHMAQALRDDAAAAGAADVDVEDAGAGGSRWNGSKLWP